MKKKIAILGSTGSIGRTLLKILYEQKENIDIVLLTANKNFKELSNQTKKFNVRNVILTDQKSYSNFKKTNKNKKLNIFKDYNSFNEIFRSKIDYVMSSIVGIEGLLPTFEIIKFTKKIAIANKESIICAWNLISNELKKNKTDFIPVDSEHFSIWYGIKKKNQSNIKKIYLTASGGPLLKVSKKKYNKLKLKEIITHPNWQMGKKISVDSATMMNKVFEVIEAKKIFNLPYKKISILIHPKSYVHAIIQFNDGMINMITHETTMEIPIFNTLNDFTSSGNNLSSKNFNKLNFDKLNNLNLSQISPMKFPVVDILNKLPQKDSLFETILVSANDEFVNLFLHKKISYIELIRKLLKYVLKKEFVKYKRIEPKKITDILELNKKIRLQINTSC